MKRWKNVLTTLGLLFMIAALVWSTYYGFTHIDDTDLRKFINNPYPLLVGMVGYFMTYYGMK